MKILLLGEYSRLHNSLKEGLTHLGHEVTIVGTGDNFKKYNVDFSIHPKFFTEYWLFRKFKNLVYILFNIDLEKTEKGIRFYFLLPKLKAFDHIQLINSDALEAHPRFGIELYKKLFKQNNCTKSLLVCGDETPVVDYLLKKELQYSILTPYFNDNFLENQFGFTLKFLKGNYRKQFDWVYKSTESLIVSDLDYKIPMERMGYSVELIPNPINIDKIEFRELEITDKIVLFLGINRMNYIKKGIAYFEDALKIIREKYPEKVEIIISENVPYSEYIKSYDKAHIVFDTMFALDQGYNALEAMAKGKVVFTGASEEFEQQYNLGEKVAIHAIPDALHLVEKLSFLIENPQEILAIGKRARKFIEMEHDYISNSKKYLESWKENN